MCFEFIIREEKNNREETSLILVITDLLICHLTTPRLLLGLHCHQHIASTTLLPLKFVKMAATAVLVPTVKAKDSQMNCAKNATL